MRLMDLINEMKIKVLSGHLTAKDKKIVKQMLDKKMDSGRVGKADYFIKNLGKEKKMTKKFLIFMISKKDEKFLVKLINKLENFKSSKIY